ncbi:MAG: hypothetical protein NVSMB53_11980 [Gemmatimonadaceae bacterium]
MSRSSRILCLAAAIPMAVLTACSDATSANRVPLSFSFATTPLGARPSVGAPVSFDLVVGTAGDLVLKSAQVVVDGIELSHTDGGALCNGNGDFECENVDQSPQIVDVPLTTGVKTLLTVPVAEGTYQRLDAHIGLQENGEHGNVSAFVTAHPEFQNNSIVVKGTYKGNPFTYASAINTDLELHFNPPVTVTTASKNITIDVDVASWFKDATGAALDPSDPANAAVIAANIRKSFGAFKDDNEDGKGDN